jgi:branched-chain amino acid transport system ATP-binding protein
LKSIAGAERPRSGTVTFDGARIDGMAQHVITSRGIAYVPENRRLFPRLSVRDNLRLGSYLYRGEGRSRGAAGSGVQAVSAPVGTARPARRNTFRRRAADAGDRPRADDPAAAVDVDEPSQGIMPKLVDEIFQAVKRIPRHRDDRADRRAAHAECLEIADRAYILQTGRVSMQGSAAEIRGESGCAQRRIWDSDFAVSLLHRRSS